MGCAEYLPNSANTLISQTSLGNLENTVPEVVGGILPGLQRFPVISNH